jgi:predicted TIM-barrel fold metal-dependent hydrolase
MLKERTTVPLIREIPGAAHPRLIILPAEAESPTTSSGRPITPAFSDIKEKLQFMDKHEILGSVISLANPWLDFLEPDEAPMATQLINEEISVLCSYAPGRLFAFGALPMASKSWPKVTAEIQRLTNMKSMRGVIMGTAGFGKGLDDPELRPVWGALAEAKFPVFLHPHYGLPPEVLGGEAYGHVMPLALGFPIETTIAVTRMFLSGIFEDGNKGENLEIILAHSGGALPFLAGRIESCILHDAHMMGGEQTQKNWTRKTVWEVLKKNIYLDAVVYSATGLKAAVDASGADRVMFG